MKVLQINKYFHIKGGADSVFFNTSALLGEQGHDVIPFSIKHPKNKYSSYSKYFINAPEIRELRGIKKLLNIPRFFSNKDAARQLGKIIQEQKPDIAHIHNLFNGISLSILPVLKKHRIPVVITLHDTRFICPSSYFNLRGKLCDNCRNLFYSNCAVHKCYQDNLTNSIMCAAEMFHKDFVFKYDQYIDRYIFVSDAYHYLHKRRHSFFETKGTVLYNFVPSLLKCAINKQQGEYLFYYGRITKEKGVVTLINVMKQFPELKLKVAGTGPLLEELKTTSPKNVEFLGFLSGDTLFNELRNSSYVIVPSEWEENNPLTVIESYAHGKPVIGSKIGGIPEIILENETGFYFEPGNADSLCAALKQAQNVLPNDYAKMSVNARDFAEQHFNPATHYNELMTIYKDTIKSYENF
ncbi:glycosyltransferase [Mangrovibacterium diazotrophicum]|uniref:Glycosyltransferase involved in cell wall biosynthesis n=1 Tax=Mangrovibacterium diazotrophicum TaxID=1261403 RepID=A0A419W996_9BACT|nr:glycosyltransferase [Mangrovibacterium diazotrophicum]RKD91984.1 glycosyltransferase involved in cell wall biosynthesis [Mangrovibacterium diazotrophicum]